MTGQSRTLAIWVFIIIAVAGCLLLFVFLRTPSEADNQFLFGYSKARLVVVILFSFLLSLNIGIVLLLGLKAGSRPVVFENRLFPWVTDHVNLVYAVLVLLAVTAGTTLLILIPPVIRIFVLFEQIGRQVDGFLLWLFLASSSLALLLRTSCRELFQKKRIPHLIDRFLLLAVLFLVVFFAYEHLLTWMGGANQSRYSYWNLLADEFLQGRLYLQHPPQTHDLTLYDGKWYVPMPPIPAVMMMPLAYLVGGMNINTSDFSIVFSAINAVLVFLILEQMLKYQWIGISRIGLALLIILFAFGTPHLWVGMRGRAWFVSQIVTVTFLALAVFAALKPWSPWVVGIGIGLAVGARPNAIMTWPFVFAITLHLLKEKNGNINFKQMVGWSVKSAVPVGMAVAGLFLYNYARFQDFFDFGYVTISGDPIIASNAQEFGLFSPHYIPANLMAMFVNLPAIRPGSEWPILPSAVGTSMFLVTPPLLYLFHRYERKWWIIGAWVSVFMNFVLLVMYHNTGAHQFGYRYILDAILPLWVLLAVSLNGRITWHYILLLLFSIAFNLYGAFWFING
jgi:hypothetical protein